MSSYESIYGAVISSTYESYWKFEFTVILTTDKGYRIKASYGGNSEDIYKFSPEDLDWDDIYIRGRFIEVLPPTS